MPEKVCYGVRKSYNRRFIMRSEVEDKARFMSFCIEQYAKAKNMAIESVVNLFENFDISEHFCEFYDVLHTHGHNWLIE